MNEAYDVVVLGTGAAGLVAHCRAALADFKVPLHLHFVTDWPMSATKIQESELACRLSSQLEYTT